MRRASALLLYALGCSHTSAAPSPPAPAAVEPAAGYVSRDTPVLLRGDGFDPSVVQHLNAGSHLALDADFSASLGDVELRDVRWIDSHTLAATVPAGVPAGMYGLTVRGPFGSGAAQGVYQAVDAVPAALTATVSAPPRALAGTDVTVTVTVSNSGTLPALGVAAGAASASGPAISLQAPAETLDIAAGASHSFVWHLTASASGLLTLALPVAGTDEVDGSAVTAQALVSIVIVTPAHLTATALRAPHSQAAGPTFEIAADMLNDGGSDALAVQFEPLSGSAIVSVVAAPDPQDVPAGATRTFLWSLRGTDEGTATLASSASATDSTGGGPILLGPLQWTVIIFKAVAVLDAVLSLPPGALPNETITVTLAVQNPGIVDALAVQPSIAVSGSGAVTLQTAPAAADIPAGQTVAFTWTYAVAAPGTVQFDTTASGTDARSGNPVTASASGTTEIGDAVPVAADPFADGAQFASVFTYAGRVYLGPSANGAVAVRMGFDGTGAETVRFGFETDFAKVGNSVSPTPTAFPSLGSIGCMPDTLECGPDNEDGRGLFTSLTVGGREWLFAAGGRQSSMLKHAYPSTDTSTTPLFPFVALNLGGGTRTATAVAGLGSALYLAFANSGGSGTPVIVRMTGLPPDSTQPLNPVLSNVQVPTELRSQRTGLIDSMLELGGWLYAANDGTFNNDGCARYDGTAWMTCTPSASQWTAKQSIMTTKSSDFVPSDKAVPQMAAFGGHLYLARNTTTGPQLWGCTPAGGVCSPGDWSLVAPNLGGDVQLSQMNDATLGTVSLLAASSQHLYVGYDSPGGVSLFRSVVPVPAAISDFSSSAVAGLGANLTHIVDGRALTVAGKESLYLAARPDTGPVRVYRLAP